VLTLRRRDLVAADACAEWLAQFDAICALRGPDLAKARAVESGLLRRLMAAGHMPRPTKYQQHILAEFPQGTPAGILGEGVPFSLERARRLFVDEGGPLAMREPPVPVEWAALPPAGMPAG
jgi:hypothetical protein